MTLNEARERAAAIWGEGATVNEGGIVAGGGWLVNVGAEGYMHALDGNGHVACGHADCLINERNLVARGRLVLRQVLGRRIGTPSQVAVWRGERCLGYITAGEEGISIVPLDGGRVQAGEGRVVVSVTVRFLDA